MRAALECIDKFLSTKMNFSVGTCAGLFITQHLKVSYFSPQTPAEQLHMMSYLRQKKNTIGALFPTSHKFTPVG